MTPEGAGVSLSAVTSAVSEWVSLAGTMLTTITSNPVLCFLFASGIVGVAIGIVSQFKHA